MASLGHPADAARHMDGIYRYQRHIYDLTRKFYLLGRDRLLSRLDVPAGGSVLELGCGTGRNLVAAARRWPDVQFHGIDVSPAMLATATAAVRRSGLAGRIRLAQGDAMDFQRHQFFERECFDRIFLSYALSMIPGWQLVLEEAVSALAPGGSLHIVDFGQQEGLPSVFRNILFAWLARFDVSPRGDLLPVVEELADRHGLVLQSERLYRGYAWLARVHRPD